MSQKLDTSPAVIGIDIGKNSFHIIGQNQRGAIVLRQKWSRGQVEARLANLPPVPRSLHHSRMRAIGRSTAARLSLGSRTGLLSLSGLLVMGFVSVISGSITGAV